MHRPMSRFLNALNRLTALVKRLNQRPAFKVGVVFAVVVLVVIAAPHAALAAQARETGIISSYIDEFINFLGSVFMSLAMWATQVIVVVLDVVTIPLMQYNEFGSSPVVSAGWAIVRDVVNMFFVVVLIFIAFGTILGVSRFKWQQQVPRLLLAALVINFSKTLATLMIDFGQVIMLTFANALQNIAAGNFIQLFGLQKIIGIAQSSGPVASATNGTSQEGLKPFHLFAAGLSAFVMMLIVLVVVVILAAILAYRIVMLWVLITLSPIAFFLGGVKGVIPKAEAAYGKWWSRFTCLVVVGPVLTFFLWLALVVAGAGNIAAAEGFKLGTSDATASAGLINEIFTASNMTSFIIGIAMIFAGLEAASEFCEGGFISSALQKGKGLSKKIAGAPAALGIAAGAYVGAGAARKVGAGARSIGKYGLREGAGLAARVPGLKYATKAGRAQLYRGLEKKAPGFAQASFARKAAELEGAKAEQLTEAAESFKGTGTSFKLAQLRKYSEEPPKTETEKLKAQALYKEAMGSKTMQDALAQTGHLQGLKDNFHDDVKATFAGDDAETEKIKDFEKRNANLFGDEGLKKIRTEADVRNLSASAVADKGFLDKLKGKGIKDEKTGEKDVVERLERGAYGYDLKQASEQGQAALIANASAANLEHVPTKVFAEMDPSQLKYIVGKNADASDRLLTSGSKEIHDKIRGDKDLKEAVLKASFDVTLDNKGDIKSFNADKATDMAKKDARMLGAFDRIDLSSKSTNADGSNAVGKQKFAATLGAAVDRPALKPFAIKFRQAPPEERAEMLDVVNNINTAQNTSLNMSFSPQQDQQTRQSKQFLKDNIDHMVKNIEGDLISEKRSANGSITQLSATRDQNQIKKINLANEINAGRYDSNPAQKQEKQKELRQLQRVIGQNIKDLREFRSKIQRLDRQIVESIPRRQDYDRLSQSTVGQIRAARDRRRERTQF